MVFAASKISFDELTIPCAKFEGSETTHCARAVTDTQSNNKPVNNILLFSPILFTFEYLGFPVCFQSADIGRTHSRRRAASISIAASHSFKITSRSIPLCLAFGKTVVLHIVQFVA